MPTVIKTGFWRKTAKPLKSELTLPEGGGASELPYKVWVGAITNINAGIQTTVYQNTLGGDFTWFEFGAGTLRGTITGAFAGQFTYLIGGNENLQAGVKIAASKLDDDSIIILNQVDGVSNDSMNKVPFEFRVYPPL